MYKLHGFILFLFLILTPPHGGVHASSTKPFAKVGPLIIKNISNKKFIKNRLYIDVEYEIDKSVHDGTTFVRFQEIVGNHDDSVDFGNVTNITSSLSTGKRNFVVQRNPNRNAAHQSKKLKIVVMDSQFKPKIHESVLINFPIDWPEYLPYAGHKNEKIFKEAQNTIDRYGRVPGVNKYQMEAAKNKLETILNRTPDYVPAYIEMARYIMKTGRFSESLGQAERLLDAAVAEDDKHADTYVLQGYVYTHQKKFKKANIALAKAQKIGTDNLWLYVNRGGLYEKMDNKKAAMLEYEKAIKFKRKNDRNDHPLETAYSNLIRLKKSYLDIDKTVWKQVDSLHQKRVNIFPNIPCFNIHYAKDLILYSTNYDKALKHAKKARRLQCSHDDLVDTVLVMSHIMKWHELLDNDKKQAERNYQRGMIRLKNMSALITTLAYTKKTQAVLNKLVEVKKINLNAKDGKDISALVNYIQAGNVDVVVALLRMGADPNTKHFNSDITPVMLAVLQKEIKILKQLLNYGGNPGLKDKQGNTALDIAIKIKRKEAVHLLMKASSV